MVDQSLSAPLVGSDESFGLSLEDLKGLFRQSNIQDGTSYRTLQNLGGTDAVEKGLMTSAKHGIDSNSVTDRLRVFGDNKPREKPAVTFCELVCDALEDTTLRILIGAACISLIVGSIEDPTDGWLEGVAILCAVVIVVSVTATNDYLKEKQFRKLSAKSDEVTVTVLRSGKELDISTYELVVGDVMKISTGSIIPADGLILEAHMMKADESSKTGESDLVAKGPFKDEAKPKTSPFMLAGSKIEEGTGWMLVGAVGANSSTGQTEELLQEDSDETPLQAKLEKIADGIGTIGFYVALFTFIVLVIYVVIDAVNRNTWDGENWHGLITSFIIAVTIIVVAVPEGLPLAVTLSLAYSVGKMKDENNLVRHLQACETMGGATDVCTDKTGTLTQNRMSVVEFYANESNVEDIRFAEVRDSEFRRLLISSCCLNSDATLVAATKQGEMDEQKGNRTECALIGLAKRWGTDYETARKESPALARVPFDSKWKWMATLSNVRGTDMIMVKGASENVIELCQYKYVNGDIVSLSDEEKKELVEKVVTPYAKKQLRTLALAYKVGSFQPDYFFENDQPNNSYITSDLVLLTIVGIKDPIRKEVPKAVKRVQKAGVKVRMVTGDNIETAISIAKDCGILAKNFERKPDEYIVMEGSQFEKLVGGLVEDKENGGKVVRDLFQFRRIAAELSVLARSSPEHKYILVTGLKQMDRVVAVTGDGSNDAPALKKSDVGFAMNIAGTQLAKDAADIILIDDNFASIVTALKWGRNIYDCIRKFIQFQVTVNITALTMSFLGAVVFHHSPLTAVQMLWVNLIMDTFAALALATEPPSNELLKRKPYGKKDSIINAEMKRNVLGASIYEICWLLVLLFLGPQIFDVRSGWEAKEWNQEDGRHFTIFFNAFVFMQIFNEINCRKLKSNEWNVFKGFFNNPLFLFILLVTIVGQLAIVHFGGAPLNCSQLTWEEHLYCVLIGAGILLFNLLFKIVPATLCTGLKISEEPERKAGLSMQQILRRDTTKHTKMASDALARAVRMKTWK